MTMGDRRYRPVLRAAIGGVLAAYGFYQDWQFQAAARKGFGTKAGGYAQVGVKVRYLFAFLCVGLSVYLWLTF